MVVVSMAIQWLRGLWAFYRDYTHSAIHAAAVAALTIFGLLIFIDPIFAVLAIISYVIPPVVLFIVGIDLETDPTQADLPATTTDSTTDPGIDSAATGDTDSDADGSDSDSDRDR